MTKLYWAYYIQVISSDINVKIAFTLLFLADKCTHHVSGALDYFTHKIQKKKKKFTTEHALPRSV